MGLLNLFKKTKPADERPTAVEYVEWLLVHMLRTSHTELKIDSTRPLPGNALTEEDADPPPCMPDAQTVVNRLKILSGVNPMRQAGVKAGGTFERIRNNHIVNFNTQFQDSAERSLCTITLNIRCVKENPCDEHLTIKMQ